MLLSASPQGSGVPVLVVSLTIKLATTTRVIAETLQKIRPYFDRGDSNAIPPHTQIVLKIEHYVKLRLCG